MRLPTLRALPPYLLRPLPTPPRFLFSRHTTGGPSSTGISYTPRHGIPLPLQPTVLKMPVEGEQPPHDLREEPVPYGDKPEITSGTVHPKLRQMAPNVYAASGVFFASAKKLQQFIADHPKALPEDLEEARKFVMQQPPGEVNAPIWNMLLGYLGRGGDLTRVWECYNIMKKRNCTPTSRTYTTVLNGYAGVAHSSLEVGVGFRRPPKVRLSQATILYVQSQGHMEWLMEERALLEERISAMEEEERTLGRARKGRRPPPPPRAPRAPERNHEEIQEPTLGELKKVLADVVEQIGVSPTNAYLKYLARYGLYKQMTALFVAMPSSGPLAPDTVTYTTMLTALFFVHKAEAGNVTHPVQIGPVARSLWDQCLRQAGRGGEAGEKIKVDNALVASLVKCLMRGSPEDGRFALTLVDEIWGLPPPGLSTAKDKPEKPVSSPLPKLFPADPASTITPATTSPHPAPKPPTLPRLDINVRAADTLINTLASASLHTLATHYTHLILSDPRLTPHLDYDFFCTVILAFARTADIQAVLDIMDSYAPIKGPQRSWPAHVWCEALTAARWASDYPAALKILRRACQLPDSLGDPARHLHPAGSPHPLPPKKHRPYVWTTPNGSTHDARGALWTRPPPVEPDARLLTLVFYTALQRGTPEALSALELFDHLGGEDAFWVYRVAYPGNYRPPKGKPAPNPVRKLREVSPTKVLAAREDVKWGVALARAVERAVEKVEGERYKGLLDRAREVCTSWGKAVEAVEKARAEEKKGVKAKAQKVQKVGKVGVVGVPGVSDGVDVTARYDAENDDDPSPSPPRQPSHATDSPAIPRSVLLSREQNKPPKGEQFHKYNNRHGEAKVPTGRGERSWTGRGRKNKKEGTRIDAYDGGEGVMGFETGERRGKAWAGEREQAGGREGREWTGERPGRRGQGEQGAWRERAGGNEGRGRAFSPRDRTELGSSGAWEPRDGQQGGNVAWRAHGQGAEHGGGVGRGEWQPRESRSGSRLARERGGDDGRGRSFERKEQGGGTERGQRAGGGERRGGGRTGGPMRSFGMKAQ